MKGPILLIMHPIFPILLWLAPTILGHLDAWGLEVVRGLVLEEPEPGQEWAAGFASSADPMPGPDFETDGALVRALQEEDAASGKAARSTRVTRIFSMGGGADGGGGAVSGLVQPVLTIVIWIIAAYFYKKGVTDLRDSKVSVGPDSDFSLAGGRDFKYGTFSCFENCQYCLFGCCCGQERMADTFSALDVVSFWPFFGGAMAVYITIALSNTILTSLVSDDMGVAFPAIGLLVQGLWAMYLATKRRQLREKLRDDAPGQSFFKDCCCYWLCSCCTIVQDARQVDGATNVAVSCACSLEKRAPPATGVPVAMGTVVGAA